VPLAQLCPNLDLTHDVGTHHSRQRPLHQLDCQQLTGELVPVWGGGGGGRADGLRGGGLCCGGGGGGGEGMGGSGSFINLTASSSLVNLSL
jgi:hypothetical protein